MNEDALISAYKQGYLQMTQWLYELNSTLDVSVDIEHTFQMACQQGHLQFAQRLYELNPTLNISANNEHAFRMACEKGHLNVAQWLYQIKPTLDISIYNHGAFRVACDFGHLDVAQWLQSLKPDIYKVVITLNKHSKILFVDTIDICPICSNTRCELKTCCNHTFCEPCIKSWLQKNNNNANNTCPCCRTCLTNTVFRPIKMKIKKKKQL